MKKEKTEKSFFKRPSYKGGKKALSLFIKENLKYPKEAIAHKIEGGVLVDYVVNDNGEVTAASVRKGLGYGCDEEAIRLVKLLTFDKVRNRGMISTFKMSVNIKFKPPIIPIKQGLQLNYNIVNASKAEKQNKSNSYTITIKIPNK